MIPTELGYSQRFDDGLFADIVDINLPQIWRNVLIALKKARAWKDVIRDFYPSFKTLLDHADGDIPKIEIRMKYPMSYAMRFKHGNKDRSIW